MKRSFAKLVEVPARAWLVALTTVVGALPLLTPDDLKVFWLP